LCRRSELARIKLGVWAPYLEPSNQKLVHQGGAISDVTRMQQLVSEVSAHAKLFRSFLIFGGFLLQEESAQGTKMFFGAINA